MLRSLLAQTAFVRAAAGLALVLGLLAIPDLGPGPVPGYRPVDALHGRIESIAAAPDATGPAAPRAKVRLIDGPRAGELVDAWLTGPGGSQLVADYRPGDEVVVTITQAADGGPPFVAITDRWRLPALGWLLAAFCAAVVIVGGWHGIRALLALGLTAAAVLKVLVPLVLRGVPPLPLAVVVAIGATVATIVLTEGLRRTSLAAILGTAAALAITGLLGAAATDALQFAYTPGSDLAFVTTPGGLGLDLRGALLAAFVLGAAGVLDDITVTQASVVSELATQPGIRPRPLVAGALRVGRSHIAATVNTLFLAYVGTGLPLLALVLLNQRPVTSILNDEVVATEIVRTLVGSIGIVAAMPLTTFIAAGLVGPAAADGPTRRAQDRRALGLTAAIAGLVALLILLPLGGRPRQAMTPGVAGPSPAAPSTASPSTASPSGGASAVLATLGVPAPVSVDGRRLVDVTVSDVRATATANGRVVRLVATYRAQADLAPDTLRWSVLTGDGALVTATVAAADLEPPAGGAGLRYLRAGESQAIVVAATIPAAAGTAHAVLSDAGSTVLLLVAIPLPPS